MPRRRVSRFLSTAPGCALPPMRSKVTAVLAVTLLGLLAGEVGALAGITSIRDEAPAHDGAQSLGEGTATAWVTPCATASVPWIWENGPIVGQIRGLWVFWR